MTLQYTHNIRTWSGNVTFLSARLFLRLVLKEFYIFQQCTYTVYIST